MIETVKCPVCGDILVYEFGFDKTTKSCDKRINHTFKLIFDKHDSLTIMTYKNLNKSPKLNVSWNFVEQRIFIGPYISVKGRPVGVTTMAAGFEYKNIIVIPWFEPDISNFPKLIKKIKTYICFS